MPGTEVIGRGGYRNEPDSRPLVRRAGMSAEPMSGLFHQAMRIYAAVKTLLQVPLHPSLRTPR